MEKFMEPIHITNDGIGNLLSLGQLGKYYWITMDTSNTLRQLAKHYWITMDTSNIQ